MSNAEFLECADRSIRRAFERLVEQRRKSGDPIVVQRNGRVVFLKPSPLPFEEWEEMPTGEF